MTANSEGFADAPLDKASRLRRDLALGWPLWTALPGSHKIACPASQQSGDLT
jgi:hypothetical protein